MVDKNKEEKTIKGSKDKNNKVHDPQKTNNQIEINPTLPDKKDITEAKKLQTVVIAWGRMNPPTIGHEQLVNVVRDQAKRYSGKAEIYLSHTKDNNKNPLSYEQKYEMASRAFGSIIKRSRAKNIIQLLKELEKRFNNLVLVVGSDRVNEFSTMLYKYNGKEYTFNSIQVVSAGERDPDSKDIVSGMSAPKMRYAVAQGNFEEFSRGLPRKLKLYAKYYFDLLKREMKIEEEISRSDRIKKSRTLKKYQPKVQRKRELQLKRRADSKRIRKRARKAARDTVKQRFMKNKSWDELSPAEKSRIEKQVNSRKKYVARLTTRMKRKVKKKETDRLRGKKSNTNEQVVELYKQIFLSE